MARLPRATFALFLSLLPACAAIIGFLVLGQMPHLREMLAIVAIVVGVAAHDESRPENEVPTSTDHAIESLVE
jgi:inner membrane transporter RhtA